MDYQLVLQLPAQSIEDYDDMIELENIIMDRLGELGTVDGHDAGSGEMNIFILTGNPKQAYEKIKAFLGTQDFAGDMKVAYRELGGEQYVILHPLGLAEFKVL